MMLGGGGELQTGETLRWGHIGEEGVFESRSILFREGLGGRGDLGEWGILVREGESG